MVVTEVVDPSGRLNMSEVKSAGVIPGTAIDPVSASPYRPSVRTVKVRSENEIASGRRLRSIVSLPVEVDRVVAGVGREHERVIAGPAGGVPYRAAQMDRDHRSRRTRAVAAGVAEARRLPRFVRRTVRTPHLIGDPNFTLEVLLVDLEQLRCADGHRSWRRRGDTIVDTWLL